MKWMKTFLVSLKVVRELTCMLITRIAPTRESKISKFNIEAYAVLEADTTQRSSTIPIPLYFFNC